MATTIAPRGQVRNVHDLGNIPIRGRHLTEDVAAWVQGAHDLQLSLSLEMHAAAVLIRRTIERSRGGGVRDRFAVRSAARRATRPLMQASSTANSAAAGVIRFWRSYMAQAHELEMASRAARGTRPTS